MALLVLKFNRDLRLVIRDCARSRHSEELKGDEESASAFSGHAAAV
jgi:hypothetical protein